MFFLNFQQDSFCLELPAALVYAALDNGLRLTTALQFFTLFQ